MENNTLQIVNNASTASATFQFKIKGLKVDLPAEVTGAAPVKAELEEISLDMHMECKTPAEVWTEFGSQVLPNLLALVQESNSMVNGGQR